MDTIIEEYGVCISDSLYSNDNKETNVKIIFFVEGIFIK